MSQMVLADIARLRKMPVLANEIKNFQPQPDPHAERMKEAEYEQAMADVDKTKSEATENYAEAELDLASAKAKAADADKTDLDFVNDEDGTTHAREVDKLGVQGETNIQLEAVKAALNPKDGNSTNKG
jgi:hypothetical protein